MAITVTRTTLVLGQQRVSHVRGFVTLCCEWESSGLRLWTMHDSDVTDTDEWFYMVVTATDGATPSYVALGDFEGHAFNGTNTLLVFRTRSPTNLALLPLSEPAPDPSDY